MNQLDKIINALDNNHKTIRIENNKKIGIIVFDETKTLDEKKETLKKYLINFAYSECKYREKITLYFFTKNHSVLIKKIDANIVLGIK